MGLSVIGAAYPSQTLVTLFIMGEIFTRTCRVRNEVGACMYTK